MSFQGTEKIQSFIRQISSLYMVNTVYAIGLTIFAIFCWGVASSSFDITGSKNFLYVSSSLLFAMYVFKVCMEHSCFVRNRVTHEESQLVISSVNAVVTFGLIYFVAQNEKLNEILYFIHHFSPALLFILISPLTWKKKDVRFFGFFGFLEWLTLLAVFFWTGGLLIRLLEEGSWFPLVGNAVIFVSPFIVSYLRKRHLSELAEKMHHEIYVDTLTQIGNRKLFYDTYDQIRERNKIGSLEKDGIVLVYVDIDFFKQYNDYYGHNMGDECLQVVASSIKEIAESIGLLSYRLGGEEFLIFGAINESEWDEAIDKDVIHLWRKGKYYIEHEHEASPFKKITLSAGACFVDRKKIYTQNAASVTKVADNLLYQAKENGRKTLVIED
jgi:diguanylate cyclase (GGDEF)-like protein